MVVVLAADAVAAGFQEHGRLQPDSERAGVEQRRVLRWCMATSCSRRPLNHEAAGGGAAAVAVPHFARAWVAANTPPLAAAGGGDSSAIGGGSMSGSGSAVAGSAAAAVAGVAASGLAAAAVAGVAAGGSAPCRGWRSGRWLGAICRGWRGGRWFEAPFAVAGVECKFWGPWWCCRPRLRLNACGLGTTGSLCARHTPSVRFLPVLSFRSTRHTNSHEFTHPYVHTLSSPSPQTRLPPANVNTWRLHSFSSLSCHHH